MKRNTIKGYLIAIAGLLFCASCNNPHENSLRNSDRVQAKLNELSLEQKIGQLVQVNNSYQYNKEGLIQDIKEGRISSILNITDPSQINELQKVAMESKAGIPLIIGRDVIHGYQTVFPIPLAQGASWNTELVEQATHVSAREARSQGITWTFSPMIDVTHDARWGRIAEGYGEDPLLTSVMGAAAIRGYQGDDMSATDRIAACAKHFAAYGATEGGRDYNTVDVSPQSLRNTYLPPYKAASEAGVASIMTAFNEINGIPATGNKQLIREVLRKEWGFNGFIVSDWASIQEMVAHGYAENDKEAARIGMQAGVEMEMASTTYIDHLLNLVKEGVIDEKEIDEAVANILSIKFELGLFDSPYVDLSKPSVIGTKENLEVARQAAVESCVLLENKNNILPLSSDFKKIAIMGPLADQKYEQLGTWIFDGNPELSVTPVMAMKEKLGDKAINFSPILAYSRDENEKEFSEAIRIAKESDVIVLCLGEESILSGEARCRAEIKLPGAQLELLHEMKKTGKPIVTVILAGRPLAIAELIPLSDAILYAWHPGSMGGEAIAQLLTGEETPSGKLPVSFPRVSGQVPLYYYKKNTGRPSSPEMWEHMDDIKVGTKQTSLGFKSHYLDAGFTPLYPFGYGLSYTNFEYSEVTLSSETMKKSGSITASVVVSNTGKREAKEVVQLYVRDLFGTTTRPIKELKGFQKISLNPGESKTIEFEITANDLAYYTSWEDKIVEAGKFKVWIGTDSSTTNEKEFLLQ